MKLLFLVPILLALAIFALLALSPKARDVAADLGHRVSHAIFGHMARNGLILGVSANGYSTPEGTRWFFSNTFAAPKTITALTNADPARASSTAHGYVDGDEILLTSGWEDATNAVYQVDQFDANSFDILGLLAADTSFYPAGTGIGTAQKISNWMQIPKVLGISTQGGDPRFTPVQPLSSRNSFNIPTGFNPTSTSIKIGHNPTDPVYQAMLGISRKFTMVAFKQVLGGGGTAYGYGYMAVSEVPEMNSGSVNQVTVTLAFQGRQISY